MFVVRNLDSGLNVLNVGVFLFQPLQFFQEFLAKKSLANS